MLPLPQWGLLPFVLLAAGAVLVQGDQTCSDKSQAITLKKSLFCGYDKTVRPVKKHTDTVTVSVKLWLKHFRFEERNNVLYLNAWTIWEWKDALLTWNPDSNSGIADLRIESDDVWVPDVSMYSMGETGGVYHRMPSTTCYLNNDGQINCAPPTSYAAYCAPNLARWPFDTQKCLVEMGSWTHGGKELYLTLDGNGIMVEDEVINREWDLLHVEGKHRSFITANDTFPYLEFTIILRRHAGCYAATVVVPAFVLAAMTILMFFLDPLSSERLSLGCMNILAHCLYMQYLGIILPSNGDSTPLIVAFFRDSLLLLGMSLLTTVTLKVMLAAERAPPAWISSAVDWVLETPPGRLIILNQWSSQNSAATLGADGSETEEGSTNPLKKKPWLSSAILLDRVCLIVFTITLIVLLLAFVP
ncbi:neuronal acetylcholine receptor subunit non-alpha-3 [Anabrus simplex]|uniref:neuronal acetylcholine receptor subunit non-alpha-3 n=1 Tax=Anabrus simplex TaxID=316456 RepID=UPI0035A35BE6